LAHHFGSTLIVAGASRTFGFGHHPRCAAAQSRGVSVHLTFVTMTGVAHHVNADGVAW
jgi:hypothetical protein